MPVLPDPEEADASERRIDRAYYEESGYFDEGGAHLRDPDSTFHRYRKEKVLELCGPVEGQRIVDLGCGWGTISFALAETAREVVGVDFAEAAIRICRARLKREPMVGLRFTRADARDTGLPGGQWDLVVAADLVEHLYPEDTLAVYREARRLLRPGGRLVVWTPNPEHLLERLRRWGVLRADPSHVDYKSLDRVVRELEAEGFDIEVAYHAESHLPIVRRVERWTLRWISIFRRRVGIRGKRS